MRPPSAHGVSLNETEGYHYAGAVGFAYLGVVAVPGLAVVVLALIRLKLWHLAVCCVVPTVLAAVALVAIVLNGDCLDADSAC